MSNDVEEMEKLLNTTAHVELNCADSNVFSISIAGKCINVTSERGNDGYGWLRYQIEDDS